MFAADPPPVVAAAPVVKPAEVVVISRDTRSEVIVSRDTPLSLIKGGKVEDALLRQAIFMTATLTVVRPATGAGEETLRWTYESYLQHQLCFTSMTGQFSCVAPELEDLTEKADGEAPLTASPGQATPNQNRPAEDARVAVATTLGVRAASLFEADRLLQLDPMLKAAGVSIRRTPISVGRR